ncbi:unnamed protein product [Protopolystoma xenopodis]|uniref:Uncharacterized protein n=1 Tax=Protopolystoma xenopodis TaxID=117903 RepID=A0A448XE51_9PLAT|nr:unnamed protein product [Protopolystoma xenopodis]
MRRESESESESESRGQDGRTDRLSRTIERPGSRAERRCTRSSTYLVTGVDAEGLVVVAAEHAQVQRRLDKLRGPVVEMIEQAEEPKEIFRVHFGVLVANVRIYESQQRHQREVNRPDDYRGEKSTLVASVRTQMSKRQSIEGRQCLLTLIGAESVLPGGLVFEASFLGLGRFDSRQ